MARNKRKRQSSEMEGSDPEEQDTPVWQITYPKPATKNSSARLRKIWNGALLHESPFHGKGCSKDALNLKYIVEPAAAWQDMRPYVKFVVAQEDYKKLDYVYVRPAHLEPDDMTDEREYWIARILEVRAVDSQHVYALIAWLYWPDDLRDAHVGGETPKSQRSWYHGKHELIASNHIEIMNVTTFAGHAPVTQWLELDEDDIQRDLYWRQTYNIRGGNLSSIRKHCVCEKFYNPDLVMLACPNEDCHIWMHQECIINNALTKAYGELPVITGNKNQKKDKSLKRPIGGKLADDLSFKDAPYRERLSGKIIDDGNKICITDLSNNRYWTENLACLKCSTALE